MGEESERRWREYIYLEKNQTTFDDKLRNDLPSSPGDTYLLPKRFPPQYSLGAGNQHFVRKQGVNVACRVPIGVKRVAIRSAAIAVPLCCHVGHREGLGSEVRGKVLECVDVLVHDVLESQPPIVRSLPLEVPHKVCKHPIDPQPGQEVVPTDVLREGFWDAVQKAEEREAYQCVL